MQLRIRLHAFMHSIHRNNTELFQQISPCITRRLQNLTSNKNRKSQMEWYILLPFVQTSLLYQLCEWDPELDLQSFTALADHQLLSPATWSHSAPHGDCLNMRLPRRSAEHTGYRTGPTPSPRPIRHPPIRKHAYAPPEVAMTTSALLTMDWYYSVGNKPKPLALNTDTSASNRLHQEPHFHAGKLGEHAGSNIKWQYIVDVRDPAVK